MVRGSPGKLGAHVRVPFRVPFNKFKGFSIWGLGVRDRPGDPNTNP